MKKILAMAIGMAAVASIASAQTATYSQNAVGFIQQETKADTLYVLTVPFVNMNSDDGTWKFGDTDLAKNAPDWSKVYFWSGTAWRQDEKDEDDGWSWSANRQLKSGEAFFFQPSEDTVVVLAGEVPTEVQPVAYAGSDNLDSIGNPYPVPVAFGKTELADQMEDWSKVYFWTGTAWRQDEKDEDDGWSWSANREIKPGEGFFVRPLEAANEWDPAKPYAWP